MEEKHHADECDNGALLNQRPLEGIDCAVDEFRTIVDRLNGYALREARPNLSQSLLDVVDNRQCVFAEPLKRNAGNDLAFPVQLGDAAPFVWRELDVRYILEQNGDAAIALDDNLLQVGQALDVAASAYRELRFRELDRPAAHVHVADAQGFANPGKRDAERL